ncbi:protease [Streptomyces acidicola]|uniref:Protease n=1 Tax=Streptomyces acidicola TaxID=2596892 RepID=A0A5N8X2A9_9ACTN|nr:protease [Streptomyces acidicola]MPY53144.1 protease [Streptomyces acidicola]
MTKLLLSLHVIAAIVAIGPVTVAASMFPPSARQALAEPGSERAVSNVRLLHRICRVYAGLGIAVPVFGLATAGAMGVMGDPWLIVSIALTVIAAIVLVVLVLPRQEEILDGLGDTTRTGAGTDAGPGADPVPARTATLTNPKATVQLAMFTGIFNLLWAVVTILMIVRPGSTTGA